MSFTSIWTSSRLCLAQTCRACRRQPSPGMQQPLLGSQSPASFRCSDEISALLSWKRIQTNTQITTISNVKAQVDSGESSLIRPPTHRTGISLELRATLRRRGGKQTG